MSKEINRLTMLIKSIAFFCFILLLTACSLEGDINALRKGPEPTITTPGMPVITSSDGFLTISWNAVDGADNYEIYINTSQTPPELPVKTVSVTTTVLDGLINKTVYYVWIKAINSTGFSNLSSFASGIPWPANEIPATPERPVIIPGINQLTVTWEKSGGASSYEVFINTSTARPPAPEITNDKTNTVIQNLENDVIYYLWIRAVNSVGKSDYSPIESGTPRIPTVAPAAPEKPVLVIGSRELIVSWPAVELAAVYEVWVGTTDNPGQAQKYGGDLNATETIITGLTNDTNYYVWIRAKNIIGTSSFSPSSNAAPSAFAALPLIPAAPTVIIGFRALDVNWQLTEGALFYEVWVGVTNNLSDAIKHGVDISGTSVTLSNLVNGTTYFIWIKAKNNIGISDFSSMSTGTPSAFAIAPSAPFAAPLVVPGSNQLTVSWQAIDGANVYEVWVGNTNNSAVAVKHSDNISELSVVLTDLNNGTTYFIWIKAKNSVGTSDFSPVSNGTPQVFAIPPQPPSAPIISICNGQLNVSWSAVQGATAYEIWLATENNATSALKHGSDIITSLSSIITGLDNGTTYFIWIKAKNSFGTSDFSPVTSGKPIANATIPSITSSNNQLTINWNTIIGADQYEVFIGTGTNLPQNVIQIIDAPITTATITGLVNGTNYNVWIRGINSTGTGLISSSVSGKPIENIGIVTLNAGNNQLTVNWSPVAGADEYEVYYNTTDSIPDTPAQTVSTTSTVINNLTNGTNYYVWVMGKNSNGTSNTSTVVNGKPLGSPGTPEITPGFRQLTVSWTAVAGADEYEVYYGIGTPTTLAITTSGTSAIISGLTGGTTYHVRILAKNPNGISDFSPIINGTPNDSLSPGLYRNGDKVGNQNLAMSLTYISSNAISGDEFIIVLGGNESISPTNLGYSNNLVKITIQGYKEERKILLHSNGNLFNINHGVTLVLNENITLVGRSVGGNGNANNNVHLVRINNGGTLILNSEAKITNNTSNSTNSNNSAGGVRVKNGGIFFMHGGEISGNISSGNTFSDGGGVWVEEGGIFEMHGGRIFANRARYGGGVLNRGVFRISNGIIYGNEASVPLNLRNTATIGTDYSALIGTASYGIINDNNFNQLGILGNTNNTIHVVNGVLQYR